MAKYTTDMDKLYEMIQNKPSGNVAPDFCASGTIRGLEGSEMFFTVPDDTDEVKFQLIPFTYDMYTVHNFFGIDTHKTLAECENLQNWNHQITGMCLGFEFKLVHKSPESHTITYVVRYTHHAIQGGPNTNMVAVFCLFGAKYKSKTATVNEPRGVHATNLDEIYEMIGSSPSGSGDFHLTSSGRLFKSGVPQPVPTDIMHFAVPKDSTDFYFIITELKERTLDTSYAPKHIHMTMQDFLALSSSGTNIIPDIKCRKVVNGDKWEVC